MNAGWSSIKGRANSSIWQKCPNFSKITLGSRLPLERKKTCRTNHHLLENLFLMLFSKKFCVIPCHCDALCTLTGGPYPLCSGGESSAYHSMQHPCLSHHNHDGCLRCHVVQEFGGTERLRSILGVVWLK
jgi:hypothetical protein